MIKGSRRTIGIDVGTATTGWAVISFLDSKFVVEGFGVIETSKHDLMPDRLLQINQELSALIAQYQPVEMCVESLFFSKNQKTVMTVSQARGVILMAGASARLPMFEYTPLQVKQAVTGYGRAEKPQVQQMVKVILGLESIPKPDDAADALAICIAHLNTSQQLLGR